MRGRRVTGSTTRSRENRPQPCRPCTTTTRSAQADDVQGVGNRRISRRVSTPRTTRRLGSRSARRNDVLGVDRRTSRARGRNELRTFPNDHSELSSDDEPITRRTPRTTQNNDVRGVRMHRDALQQSDSPSTDSEISVDDAPQRTLGTIPAVPRTGHLSKRTIQKIKRGEYVSFASLLPKPHDSSDRKRYNINPDTGLFEKVKETKTLNFYTWLDCFIVFMSVRLQHFPNENQGLLRHLQVVKNMHNQRRNAIEYDHQFRITKEQHPSIQWGEYLPELADKITAKAERERLTPRSQTKGKMALCLKFNSIQGCHFPNCIYTHKCRRCGRTGHGNSQCTGQVALRP